MISEELTNIWQRQGSRGRHSSILLVGTNLFIPDSNLIAVMHEFPLLAIRAAATLAESLADIDPPPGAVLIHETCFAEATDMELSLLASHGDRVVLAVVENAKHTSSAVVHLMTSGLVRGILPMNLPLETWLLALRLMLRGGEFVPLSLARLGLARAGGQAAAAPAAKPPQPGMGTLTVRETEVLHLLAMGCPNRVIADRLRLSEHTVKVHVHNIIRKLAVKNRTAAAAAYLETTAKPVRDAALPRLPTFFDRV